MLQPPFNNTFKAEVLDLVPVIIALHDRDYNIVWANKAYQKATGLTLKEIEGKKCFSVWKLTKPCRGCPVLTAIETGKQQEAELTPENQDHWPATQGSWLSKAVPIRDAEGNIIGAMETAYAITERHQFEVMLQKNEREKSTILDTMSDLVIYQDLNHNILWANKSAAESVNEKPENLTGRKCHEIWANRKEECEACPVIKAIETGRMHQNTITTPDERVWIVNGYPIKDEKEIITGAVEVTTDITERKQAEESLRENEKKYRAILETTLEGCWLITSDRKILEVNPALCKMLGYSTEEMLGKIPYDFVDDENKKIFIEQISKIASTKHRSYEIVLKKKTGEDLPAYFNATTIRDKSGKVQGSFAFVSDITERKQAEEEKEKLQAQLTQAQKMEAIGTLAGGIAHDFNNILSSVLGFTELAIDAVEKDSTIEENLQEVYTAGIRAKDLVNQILLLSRHDAVQFKPIHINSVVKEAVKMIRSIIPASIDIQKNICNRQLVVSADPTQIHQVIVNLITNAKHAMSESVGVLAVEVDPVSFDDESTENINLTPGNYARIMVSDTGTGINKEHLEKIFEPYFTTKAVGEGTGLGLSVVHGIIKSHQGDITVHSESGKGTTFYIYLPLSEQRSVELPETDTNPLPTGTERILLVDDEPSIVKMQQQSLEKVGYTATAKTSSVEALETFCATPDKFDLVITDMTMPKMTGDKFAEEIKKIRSDVPVILCTGFSDKIKIRTGSDLQIDEFLMKPVNKKKLAKTVRKLLDEAKSKTQQ